LRRHYLVANGNGANNHVHGAYENAITHFNRAYAIVYKTEIFNGTVVTHLKDIKRHGINPGPAENAGIAAFFVIEGIYKMPYPPARPQTCPGGDKP
jgi:hypothetical protein